MICCKPFNINQSHTATSFTDMVYILTNTTYTNHKEATYAKACKMDMCRNDLRDCILGNYIILVTLYIFLKLNKLVCHKIVKILMQEIIKNTESCVIL
jgi:hypothetical protein